MRKLEEVPVCTLCGSHMWQCGNVAAAAILADIKQGPLMMKISAQCSILELNKTPKVFIFPQETVEWFQSVLGWRDKENKFYNFSRG